MKRLYYLSPSIDSADSVSRDLHEQGITDWNFHIVSTDQDGLYRHHLHSANALHKTDVVRFMERGLMSGGLIGILFLFPLLNIEQFTLNAWIAITAFSIFFGGWFGGVGGLNTENYKIRRFHKQILQGSHLVMIDVKPKDEQRIMAIMAVRHPEAILQGYGSTITNPFAQDNSVHVHSVKMS